MILVGISGIRTRTSSKGRSLRKLFPKIDLRLPNVALRVAGILRGIKGTRENLNTIIQFGCFGVFDCLACIFIFLLLVSSFFHRRKVVLLRTGQNSMHKTEDIDISAAISLFEIKLSERSGFVRDVKAAENLLREYELANTTNFCCNKAKKGFGTTGMYIIFDCHIK